LSERKEGRPEGKEGRTHVNFIWSSWWGRLETAPTRSINEGGLHADRQKIFNYHGLTLCLKKRKQTISQNVQEKEAAIDRKGMIEKGGNKTPSIWDSWS